MEKSSKKQMRDSTSSWMKNTTSKLTNQSINSIVRPKKTLNDSKSKKNVNPSAVNKKIERIPSMDLYHYAEVYYAWYESQILSKTKFNNVKNYV